EAKYQPEMITADFAYLRDSKTLIHFTSITADDEKNTLTKVRGSEGQIMAWGKRNSLPMLREELVRNNNIIGPLIATKRDITLGAGLVAYKEVELPDGKFGTQVVAMPEAAKEFFKTVKISQFLRNACKNLIFHGQYFVEYVRDRGGRIYSMKSMECRHVRAEKMTDKGVIKNWWWCGNWLRAKNMPEADPVMVPAFISEEAKQAKFIYRAGDDIAGDDYYFTPVWWGGRTWIELSNVIPEFHKNNMQHGYSIRYHIQIPKGYFDDSTSIAQTPGLEAKQLLIDGANQAKADFIGKMNQYLAGATNAGRAVFTDYELQAAAGRDMPGIKITPLNVDLKDESLLKLFEKSNQANISAQGIPPTLANIETQGKLSSGSEIRNAFLMYVAIKTPLPRSILLEAIEIVKEANGWDPDIKFGFKDMILTTLDDEPSGMTEKNPEA
ncbi:MAG: hypothetical protein ABI002_06180, partial [Saprospiraceae bacterium]